MSKPALNDVNAYLRRSGVSPEHAQGADDPWGLEDWTQDEVDAEDAPAGAAAPELDARSYARWLQSVLRATVDGSLPVDGRVGVRTRAALLRFQAHGSRLGVQGPPLKRTGSADGATLAALQAVAGVAAPEGAPEEAALDGEPLFVANDFLLAALPSVAAGATQPVLALGGADVRVLVDGRARPIVGRVPLRLDRASLPSPPAPTPATSPARPNLGVSALAGRPGLAAALRPSSAVTIAPAHAKVLTGGSHSAAASKPIVMKAQISPVQLAAGSRPVSFATSAQPLSAPASKAFAVTRQATVVSLPAPKFMALTKAQKIKAIQPQWVSTHVVAESRGEALSVDQGRWVSFLDRSLRDRIVGGRRPGVAPGPAGGVSSEPPVDETPLDRPIDTTPAAPEPTPDAEAHADETIPTPREPALELVDASSFPRWAQSTLRATVEPELAVDGIVGPKTRAATSLFQRTVPTWVPGADALPDSGTLTAPTVTALEWATGVGRPDYPGIAIPDTPPPPLEGLTPAEAHTEIDSQGRVWNVVRQYGDEVRFRYRVKEIHLPEQGRVEDVYNVWSYEGERTGLLTDADLMSAGFGVSGVKILKENALRESGGKFGAVNTWDNQYVSWGMAQFAGHAGTLANLMADLAEHPSSAAAFQRFFRANGIDVAHGPYPYWQRSPARFITKTGWHVVVHGDALHLGDLGWLYLRTQPRLVGALMLAGNDRSLQVGQVRFWRERFFERALNRQVLSTSRPIRQFVTSELGLGLAARLFNWMPAYLPRWFQEIVDSLAPEHPGEDLTQPSTWARLPELEAKYIVRMRDKRRAAKSGSWDSYGGTLSPERGSYR